MATSVCYRPYLKLECLLRWEKYLLPFPKSKVLHRLQCSLCNTQQNHLVDTFVSYNKYETKTLKVRFLGQAVLTALTFASLCLILFSFSGFGLRLLTDNADAAIDNRAKSIYISKNPPVALKSSTIDQPTPPNFLGGF